jgi:transcriptional regulator with XRE-family HTH domain
VVFNLRLGERVHYLLKQYNRSQKELADFLNTKTSTINGWKQPNRNPSSDMIVPICKFFNISTYYFLTGHTDYINYQDNSNGSLLIHEEIIPREDEPNISDCKQDIMFNRDIFSKRLLELRNKNNIMANDIATSIGISKQAYSQYEKQLSTPSVNALISIARYFDVSLDYLTGLSDNPNIEQEKNNKYIATTEKEKDLLKDFRLLNGLEQNVIIGKVSEIIYNRSKTENTEMEVSNELVNTRNK